MVREKIVIRKSLKKSLFWTFYSNHYRLGSRILNHFNVKPIRQSCWFSSTTDPIYIFLSKNNVFVKWSASYRWSFSPNSAWGSKETTILGNTHPSLVKLCRVGLLFRNWLYKVHFVFSILKDKLKVIMFYIAPSGRKIQKLEFPSFKSSHWYLQLVFTRL